jgi:hypothetical protein
MPKDGPLAVAALTLFGLFSALLGQTGAWLALSWAALSAPLAIVAICVKRMVRNGAIS